MATSYALCSVSRCIPTSAGSGYANDQKHQRFTSSRYLYFRFSGSKPVLAWALTMLLDNNGLIGDKERAAKLSFIDKVVIPGGVLIICLIAMLAVGMLESQYGLQAWL